MVLIAFRIFALRAPQAIDLIAKETRHVAVNDVARCVSRIACGSAQPQAGRE
jgi:hypothetical protein